MTFSATWEGEAPAEPRARGACHRLLLVAPPHFLGLLRQAAPPAVRAAITAGVDHDWTQVAVQDLPARLANELGLP